MWHSLRRVATRHLPFTAGLVLALAILLGGAGLTVHRASAACAGDDDANAIIRCGFTSASQFISDVQANDSDGHHDLQAVYANYGLTTADYASFEKTAVTGKAYKDGTIRLSDGTVVATNTKSIGRLESYQGSNPFSVTIHGTTYWGNTNAKAFASDGLPVLVWLNNQGTMQFAVIESCGNPIFGASTPTAASCRSLTKTAVPNEMNTYDFTASMNTSGNATPREYVFDFGDGHTQTVKSTSSSVNVRYTYTKAGTYNAKVTEFASVPGNGNLQLPVISMCTKTVVVSLPFCVGLTGVIIDKSKFEAQFTATANLVPGAKLMSADFSFGDGKVQNGVKPATPTTVVVTHDYPSGGTTFDAAATLHFSTGIGSTTVTAPTCRAEVTPQTIVQECKPGVPVGSAECLPPCQPGSSVPPESAQCQTPSLPNTGAGNVIAIFAAVVVAGFLAYRHVLFRRHKAAFLAAQQGTSALPLGDPLDIDAPLAGTPVAPKRRTFRRKRPF